MVVNFTINIYRLNINLYINKDLQEVYFEDIHHSVVYLVDIETQEFEMCLRYTHTIYTQHVLIPNVYIYICLCDLYIINLFSFQ